MKERITRIDILSLIKENVKKDNFDYGETGISKEDVLLCLNNFLLQIKKKQEREKRIYHEKGDEIKDLVESLLSNEYQTAEDLAEALSEEIGDITHHKVVARLTQLINDGVAEKMSLKLKEGRRVGYRLRQEENK